MRLPGWLRSLWSRFDDRGPIAEAAIDNASLAHREALLRREARLVKDVDRLLKRLLKQVRIQAKAIGKRTADAQAAGLDVQPWWIYQEARAQALIDLLRSEIKALSEPLATRTLDEAGRAVTASLADAEALMTLAANPAPLAPAFVQVNPEAIRSALGFWGSSSPLQKLFEAIGPDVAVKAREVITRSIAEGWGGRKLGRELEREVSGLTRQRAVLIARTETNRAYREATRQSYMANTDVVIGVRWLAAKSSRTCAGCLAMDGRIFPVDYRMSSHPACRCRLVPVTATSLPPLTTSEEFLKGLTVKERRRILGRVGQTGFDSGHLTMRNFSREKFSPEWGWSVQPQTQQKLFLDARARASAAGQTLDIVDAQRGRPWPRYRGSRDLAANPSQREVLPQAPRALPIATLQSQPLQQQRQPLASPPPRGGMNPQDLANWQRLSGAASARSVNLFGAPVSVVKTQEAADHLEALLGYQPTDEQIADMVGALGGSRIRVDKTFNGWINFNVVHPDVIQHRRTLRPDSSGALFIHNEELKLQVNKRGSGIGPLIFQKQVEGCIRTPGLSWIETWGARLPNFPDGYRVWPNMGYDQVLPASVKRIPKKFGNPKTVQDLLAHPDGKAWWAKNGKDLKELKFDLSDGSLSRHIHDALMDAYDVRFSESVEDPGLSEGDDYGLPAIDHARSVQMWMKTNQPAKFARMFPSGSRDRLA